MSELNLGTLTAHLEASTAGLQAAEAAIKRLTDKMEAHFKGVQKSADNVDRSMEKVKKTAGGMEAAFGRAGKMIAGYFAADKLWNFAKAVFETGTRMEALNRAFKTITGSSSGAAHEMEFLRKTASGLGLHFMSVADAYKEISAAAQGTKLAGDQTRKIFTAVSEASVVLGMSADETAGALRAISQMISKGNVQAEELRGQLGERLPGAFSMAAEAMGVTTQQLNKMLDNGEVLADDLLPLLAKVLHDRFGQAAVEAAGSARAELNRLQTAWDDFKSALTSGDTMNALAGNINALAVSLQYLTKVMKLVPWDKLLELDGLNPMYWASGVAPAYKLWKTLHGPDTEAGRQQALVTATQEKLNLKQAEMAKLQGPEGAEEFIKLLTLRGLSREDAETSLDARRGRLAEEIAELQQTLSVTQRTLQKMVNFNPNGEIDVDMAFEGTPEGGGGSGL
ncbi:MAG: tape measure protein, partial [Thermodesulfobacteriota bacterium]